MQYQAWEIIRSLGMHPHPEGGWYIETFRDPDEVNGRSRSTAIYYLLEQEQISHWHREDAAEVWLWHAGAPLLLSVSEDGETTRDVTLGPDVVAGERPQGIVPTNAWQSARSLGDWTLVSCTVAPGFEFEGFELAKPDWAPADRRAVSDASDT